MYSDGDMMWRELNESILLEGTPLCEGKVEQSEGKVEENEGKVEHSEREVGQSDGRKNRMKRGRTE